MGLETIEARWPTGGLHRRMGFQHQPPYTSADLLNVRADSSLDSRERGGSRPGLTKAFNTQLGGGNPVRLLTSIREVYSTQQLRTTEDFDGTALSALWTAMPWSGNFNGDATGGLPTAPEVADGLVKSKATGTGNNWEIQAAVRQAVAMDTGQVYSVMATILPVEGSLGGEYFLFIGLDDTTPNVQLNGVGFKAIITPENPGITVQVDLSIDQVVAGVITSFPQASYMAQSAVAPMTIHISVNGTAITVGRNGSALGPQIVNAAAQVGSRIGFGVRHLENITVARQACMADLTLSYFPDTDNFTVLNRTRVLASANGTLYRESAAMSLEAVTDVNGLDLASDVMLQSADRLGYLFIADQGVRDQGTDGVISAAADQGSTYDETRYTATFDDAGAQDWTTVADVGDTLWIYNATTAANIRLCRITAVVAASISIASSTAFANESGASYRVLRGLKVYSSAANTLRSWTTALASGSTTNYKGTIPLACTLICAFMDRMVVAGDRTAPHVWYMSAQGDPYNFDHTVTATNLRRAVISTSSDAGEFGEPITALIPWHDDFLVFGCTHSLWMLRGNPAAGGIIDNLSRTVGCLSARSWCFAPGGELFILGADGLYSFLAGAGGFSESARRVSLSRDRIPEELVNINPQDHYITMDYDVLDRGLHIFVTPAMATAGIRHWWVDLEGADKAAFYPLTIPFTFDPCHATYYHADDQVSSAMLLGGRDGYVRRFARLSPNDDGTDFSSYAYLGPFALGSRTTKEGILAELDAVVPLLSNPVDWVVLAGEHEEAALAAPVANGRFEPGVSRRARPRRRGRAAYLKLTGTAPWSVEGVTMVRKPSGRQRVA